MAKLEILAPFILSFEGGWANHPNDHGGATNMGVTLKTWMSVGFDKDLDGDIDVDDLRLIDTSDVVERVMRPSYWNKMRGDQIESQAVANIIVDWAWMTGPVKVAKKIQRIVGVTADGIVGPMTIAAINGMNDYKLFCAIMAERRAFYQDIVRNDPSQSVFFNGWMRRLLAINYTELTANGGSKIYF